MIRWLIQADADCDPRLDRWLSAWEQERAAAFRTEKRRREWLLGRWTAKLVLQETIQRESGKLIARSALTIANDADGAPFAQYQDLTGPLDLSGLALSISHSQGRAFCAAALGDRAGRGERPRLGADIEYVEPRSEAFVDGYLTEEEIARVRRAPAPRRDQMVTAIWSAKEAALKALYLGLSVDTRAVTCEIDPAAEPAESWTPFGIGCDARFLPPPTPRLTGWWREQDEYVLTLVVRDTTVGATRVEGGAE